MYFNAFHQCPDDLALGVEIYRIQSVINRFCKILQTTDHKKQFKLADVMLFALFNLPLQLLDLDLQLAYLWFEVRFIN